MRKTFSILLLLLGGCTDEIDVDVVVVLPHIVTQQSLHGPVATTCDFADITRVELHVVGPGSEDFSIDAEPCVYESERDVVGFGFSDEALRFTRLLPEYYRLEATFTGSDGSVRGKRTQPFDAAEAQLVVIAERADLPSWPSTAVTLTFPGCRREAGLDSVRVTIVPEAAVAPALVTTVICTDSDVTVLDTMLPLGPASVTVDGLVDGASRCSITDSPIVAAEDARSFEIRVSEACIP